MIKFGMQLMEIVEQLTRGFVKATGKQPGNLEKLKIQQEAVQRFKEMNKVVDMEGRAMDTTKPIVGGTQEGAALKSGIMKTMGARPKQVLSEDEIRQKLMDQNKKGIASMKSKLDDPEERAMGGRIGYKVGAGKKGVQALLDLVREKFGKSAATTADKAPIPPKTLERDMFKKADKRLNDKRMLDDDEIEDFALEVGELDAYDFDGTVGSRDRILKERKDEYDYMYDQYKRGKLDPEPGDKSEARMNLLRKRAEEMEMSGDKRLLNPDEMDELEELEAIYLDNVDEAYGVDTAMRKELNEMKKLGAPKLSERLELKQKYPGISDDLLDRILIDDNPQRKAEVLGTLDEAFAMMKKGKGPDEVLRIIKDINRTKQADGGRIGLKAGMTKRGFLKLMGGVGASIGAAKSGIFSGLGKGAGKTVAKEVVKNSSGKPPAYFFNLVNKIKTQGEDITQKTATQEREIVTEYKDYRLTEDLGTGRQTIQKTKLDTNEQYYDETLAEQTYMDYIPGKGQSDESTGKVADEYIEDTSYLRTSGPQKGEVLDVVDGVPEEVIEEGTMFEDTMTEFGKTKKASGGIARMLGE